MSTSVVLSPHHTGLALPEPSSGGGRTRRSTYNTSRSTRNSNASPVPTESSRSSGSRKRGSLSPIKMSTRTRAAAKRDGPVHDEEGESEIDHQSRSMESQEYEEPEEQEMPGDEESPELTETGRSSSVREPTEDVVVELSPEAPLRVRLALGKRKAESEDVESESALSVEMEGEEGNEPIEAVEGLEEVNTEAMNLDEADKETAMEEVSAEKFRRAPRKKRRWLKKGEVDPDDPIAVAKQQERHRLIDEAITHIERQVQMIEDDTHPQLKWMLEELERRYNLQIQRVEATYQATLSDLGKMRKHDKQESRFMWTQHREDLVDEMTAEKRLKIRKIDAEIGALKRDPNEYPQMRDGRGHGGWKMFDGNLLSKSQQNLVPVDTQTDRQRRDIAFDVEGLPRRTARDDLKKMLVRPAVPESASRDRHGSMSRLYGDRMPPRPRTYGHPAWQPFHDAVAAAKQRTLYEPDAPPNLPQGPAPLYPYEPVRAPYRNPPPPSTMPPYRAPPDSGRSTPSTSSPQKPAQRQDRVMSTGQRVMNTRPPGLDRSHVPPPPPQVQPEAKRTQPKYLPMSYGHDRPAEQNRSRDWSGRNPSNPLGDPPPRDTPAATPARPAPAPSRAPQINPSRPPPSNMPYGMFDMGFPTGFSDRYAREDKYLPMGMSSPETASSNRKEVDVRRDEREKRRIEEEMQRENQLRDKMEADRKRVQERFAIPPFRRAL